MMHDTEGYSPYEIEYLRLLAKEYPTAQKAATEIINLNAILGLPKATEHFMSDIHGQNDAFTHVMNSASGAIRDKIDTLLGGELNEEERAKLASLIYYPKEKLQLLLQEEPDEIEFYKRTLNHLIELCHMITSKYTRSKVRKALPEEYAYVIDELLNQDFTLNNKQEYYDNIISTIINIGKADDFIEAVCGVIKRLIVDRLHIIGDVFDRGPRADLVMEDLMQHHAVDIQWGNHDILWMGAAAGSPICIATVLSNSILYNNLYVIESGYGISLRKLAVFADEFYTMTDVHSFATRILDKKEKERTTHKELVRTARMSKAITVILFKLMGQVVKRNPDFEMDDRLLLHKVDYDHGTVDLYGTEYPMNDCDFPTIDRNDPYKLTEEESEVMANLVMEFKASEKLQKHIRFLYRVGGMYLVYNNNLLLHGGVPMNEDGSFKSFEYHGATYNGRRLLDLCEKKAKDAYFAPEGSEAKESGMDFTFYLWCGKKSPLFCRDRITTFERRFVDDKSTWKESKDPYYEITKTEDGCLKILHEFGLGDKDSHIINGHVPVKVKDGESPIRGNGRLFNIDGGFSKAYQKTTGIAGYSLIYNSYVMKLVAHEPFPGKEEVLKNNKDIQHMTDVTEELQDRLMISDTDNGAKLQRNIKRLTKLMEAYKSGVIPENLGKND